MVIVERATLIRQLCRGSKADAQRGRQGSRSQPLLLTATVNERRRLLALPHPQGADAFRAMNLVCRDRDQVGSVTQLNPAECLDGVGNQQGSSLVDQFRD